MPVNPAGLPNPDDGLTLAARQRSASELARQIARAHQRGKSDRRLRDVTAEKYLLHTDGEADSQWATIVNGQRVEVPFKIGGGLRLQWNLLRPILTNAVGHHTAMPLRVMAKAPSGQQARDKALVDTIFANHTIDHQNLNLKATEAMFLAGAYGHCPIHAMWRDDLTADFFEPVYNTGEQYGQAMHPGFVDFFVGDPWGTVYPSGATRDSVHWYSYERILPADLVRQAFPHIKGLEGTTTIPSASRFQRIARKWALRQSHGAAALTATSDGEELVALLCKEIVPGYDPQYPQGALQIVALSGSEDVDQEMSGTPTLLHDGPLPGGRPSATRFYMDLRSDDVLGKPFVADLDDLQVQLNQYVTDQAEWARRFNRPPLWINGQYEIEDDSSVYDDDVVIQTQGQGSQVNFLYPPNTSGSPYQWLIESTMERMWQLGGYQAASRGESNAGDAAAKVVALARADDTLFGPVNRFYHNSVSNLLQTAHALARENMTTPLLVSITGDEYGHLAEPWITAAQMSETPPIYEVTSGAGATKEAKDQQLLSLVGMVGADGEPILPTRQMKKLWSDKSLIRQDTDIIEVRERRATVINYEIRKAAEALSQKVQQAAQQIQQMPPEWQQYGAMQLQQMQAAAPQQIEAQVFGRFPVEYTDIPQMHIDKLDELIQDPNIDPLTQQVARIRQGRYVQRAMQIWQSQAGYAAPQGKPSGGQTAQGKAVPQGGGTMTSDAMAPETLSGTVQNLTNSAA